MIAIVLFAASAARAAAPAFIDGLLSGGPAGQARTIDGESIWLDQIRFSTPRDFDKLPAGQPQLNFDTVPEAPPFQAIEELSFETITEELIGSQPDKMETYRLGSTRMAVPPPPDWKRSIGQIPPWSRAAAVAEVDHLPFINGAVFCWAAGAPAQAGSTNVYLFRQAFEINQFDRVARATLRIATNGDPIEISLNDHPVQLPAKVSYGLATYEITPLLQPNINLLAIRISERPRSTETKYGVAFHVELLRRAKETAPPAIKQGEALLTSKSGDRLWGMIHDVNAEGITLDSAYGRYRLKWDDCSALIFPNGWRRESEQPEPKAQKGRVEQPAAWPVAGLPLSASPQTLQDCLLLTENRRTTARPGFARDGQLFFESGDGKQFSIPISEILGIYPPQPLEWVYQKPRPDSAVLYCRLQTTRGEQVTGLLRQLKGANVVLETESGNFLELKPRWISTIYFPFHAAGAQPRLRQTAARVAVIPLATGSEAYRTTYQSDLRRVQAAAFSVGGEVVNLAMDSLADPGQLTPTRYPVLVYIDPVGEYLHTMKEGGDAQKTLIQFVEQGGRLIVLSRGGAFRTTIRNDGLQLRRAPAEMTSPNLADALGVRVVKPASGATGGATPFNHPPNNGRTVMFRRASQMPRDLLGLERQVRLESILSAPFYPMVATGSGAIPLYDLNDDSGKTYGPGMQIVPKGRGMVLVIDHLLWESLIDDIPFSERELPKVFNWALGGGQ